MLIPEFKSFANCFTVLVEFSFRGCVKFPQIFALNNPNQNKHAEKILYQMHVFNQTIIEIWPFSRRFRVIQLFCQDLEKAVNIRLKYKVYAKKG